LAVQPREGRKGSFAGQAIAITTLTPVRPEKLGKLKFRMWFVRCVPGVGRPLAKLAFIYFGRWTVVEALPGHSLNSPYLLFESNYDGGWADYLDAFADRIPGRLTRMWETCYGFEQEVLHARGRDGRPFQPAPFKRYVDKNELEVLHFYSAYPEETTRTVNQAIALADRLEREGLDETSKRLALGPVPEQRPPLVRFAGGVRSWLRMVTGKYGVYPLTAATPVVPERERELKEHLRGLEAVRSPLADVPGTHFARFVWIPEALLDLGQPAPDRLDTPYLLFTSNHDGSQEDYLRALAPIAEPIWGACRDYPRDPAAFPRWLGSHTIDTRYFVIGFPPRSAAEVQRAAAQRRRIAEELARA
jgi:hypothetical protein